MRKLAALLTVLAVLALARTSHAQQELPPSLRGVGIEQKLGASVPWHSAFRDHLGHNVELGDYFKGKPVILVLAYFRCPMLCNQVLSGLVECLRGVPFNAGEQYEVVIVSFDARETPELAAAKKSWCEEQYGRATQADGWHLLTGAQTAIDELAQSVGFHYRYDAAHDQFAHASGIAILTPRGQVARYFLGIHYPARDVRLSLVEASSNKIGSAVDQVLLFCFHFDESTGRYTAAVMRLVRLTGILTLVGLAGLLFQLWRRSSAGVVLAR